MPVVPARFFAAIAAVSVCALAASLTCSASADPALLAEEGRDGALPVLRWNVSAVRSAASAGGTLRIPRVPLAEGLEVDLELEPFSVTGPGTRFVLGRLDAPDEPLDFDPDSITLLRGTVAGRPGSRVVLALHGGETTGVVDLGPGDRRYHLSGKGATGRALGAGRAAVFETTGGHAELPPGVPFCGTEATQPESAPAVMLQAQSPEPPAVGIRHLELAVETDYEFFTLFGDAASAAAYLVALYAQVSDIYLRDQDTWIDLVYARIWDTPNDLFNEVDPSPLPEFRDYWNSNMGSVGRDIAQLLSGRRDYPFGGQAYLSTLCSGSGYSVVGYALGAFPDPSTPSPFNYDISVTAHEIGHNAGTGHSHDPPNFVDTCDDPLTTPQRGTIMSYCAQTWSGGNANRDLYFHSVIQANIDAEIAASGCVVVDCNTNGVADFVELANGEPDVNGNGIPDVCENCNGNGTLDPQDIALGTSTDLNGNLVPDDCEPDCNGNLVPDDRDIALGTSLDAYGNDVPDECEADCDGDFTSDYTEIQLDMSLDVDRDRILDACEDCDGDGTPDLVELGRSHDLWLASGLAGVPLRGFHASTGVLTRVSGVPLDEAQDLLVAPGGRVLVSSGGDDRVVEFDLDGVFQSDLVPPGAGGLDHPTGLLWLPDGRLLVASANTDSVLAYDGSNGTPLGAFVAAGSGGLSEPYGLALGPNGNLFVASSSNEVIEYDGQGGAFVGVFVTAAANGGLDRPRGLVFKPDGDLLVTSFGTDETLAYHGETGFALGPWAASGTATVLTQESPWGIRIGPNGNVFIVRTGEAFGSSGGSEHDHSELHFTNAQMYEFDVRTGNFLRAHINGNDHGMEFPTGFDFVPGWELDCNTNHVQDDCDVAAGTSLDLTGNGIPDECEIDCNANGILDRLDVIPFGDEFDCNANLVPDSCDSQAGMPGACEPDFERSCSDGFDNDRDGLADCFDSDCDPATACPGTILLAASFAGGAEGFAYMDDAFRGTNAPAYASGVALGTGGNRGSGGLAVNVGGVDGIDVFGMSGAWERDLVLAGPETLRVSVRFNLTQGRDYDAGEISQMMASLDGIPFGPAPDDFLAEMQGDGNGGEERSTGWMVFSADLGPIAAGTHSFAFGAYNNRKTSASEETELRIDDIGIITASGPPDCGNGVDDDGDGRTDYPVDAGCDDALDPSEWSPRRVCDNGLDDDGDGARDYPDDIGCRSIGSNTESPACSDGLDNDGDGFTDWDGGGAGAADPECGGNAALNREQAGTACGLGFELVGVLGAIARLQRLRRRSKASESVV